MCSLRASYKTAPMAQPQEAALSDVRRFRGARAQVHSCGELSHGRALGRGGGASVQVRCTRCSGDHSIVLVEAHTSHMDLCILRMVALDTVSLPSLCAVVKLFLSSVLAWRVCTAPHDHTAGYRARCIHTSWWQL